MLLQASQNLGAGIGIGFVFSSLIIGTFRNPGLKDELFKFAILGFALTEAIALFALMLAFLILFVKMSCVFKIECFRIWFFYFFNFL